MTECPHCDFEIRKGDKHAAGLKSSAKKKYKLKLRRKFNGDVLYKNFGHNGLGNAPDDAMSVEICRSCGWTSVNRKDGKKYTVKDGTVITSWRNMITGQNLDWKVIVRRNGW